MTLNKLGIVLCILGSHHFLNGQSIGFENLDVPFSIDRLSVKFNFRDSSLIGKKIHAVYEINCPKEDAVCNGDTVKICLYDNLSRIKEIYYLNGRDRRAKARYFSYLGDSSLTVRNVEINRQDTVETSKSHYSYTDTSLYINWNNSSGDSAYSKFVFDKPSKRLISKEGYNITKAEKDAYKFIVKTDSCCSGIKVFQLIDTTGLSGSEYLFCSGNLPIKYINKSRKDDVSCYDYFYHESKIALEVQSTSNELNLNQITAKVEYDWDQNFIKNIKTNLTDGTLTELKLFYSENLLDKKMWYVDGRFMNGTMIKYK